jgi:hypothetical protein
MAVLKNIFGRKKKNKGEVEEGEEETQKVNDIEQAQDDDPHVSRQ